MANAVAEGRQENLVRFKEKWENGLILVRAGILSKWGKCALYGEKELNFAQIGSEKCVFTIF